ncbi:unnamed protein product [Aphanomyces euteiches]
MADSCIEHQEWVCENNVRSFGRRVYDQHHAEASLHAANGVAESGNSLSSYPHEFKNKPGFRFPRAECNNLKEGQYLLEYPLFRDTIYKQNPTTKRPVKNRAQSEEKKPLPGPARVIYLARTKTFCGVITHVGQGNEPSEGGFALCARRTRRG